MLRQTVSQFTTTRYWLWLLIPRIVNARSWRDVETYHDISLPDNDNLGAIESDPFFFIREAPTAAEIAPRPVGAPSFFDITSPVGRPLRDTLRPTSTPREINDPTPNPTLKRTPSPTRSPTQIPTSAPTEEKWPPAPLPFYVQRSYFNYDDRIDANYGPGYPILRFDQGFTIAYENNAWANVQVPSNSYWSEFDTNGYGAWQGVLESRNPTTNQCGNVGTQSPIDVRMSGVACIEHHQIRTRSGDHRIRGAGVEKRIESNKLRLVYQRRPCADITNPDCAEPDPPTADFPTGWGGFADVIHVDFKFPAEHRINGETYDGEMQIYHLHDGRRRVAAISSLMKVEEDAYNTYLQTAIDSFQYQYNLNRAQCADHVRRGRKLSTDLPNDMLHGNYSSLLDDPEFIAEGIEHERRMQSSIWYPHHEDLIPTYWFYGYDGSLTEPPCSEFVSWFIMDEPMIIGPTQLEQMKNIIFTHIDPDCRETSVHFGGSVARPLQEAAGRQVWRCTRQHYVPDKERDKS